MSIPSTVKFTNANIFTALPKLKSLTDYCCLVDIPNQSFDENWLSLFEFITYNTSLSNASFKTKIDELKYFIRLKDSEPHIVQYLQAFNFSIYFRVIRNYFTAFTIAINRKEFYNNKENAGLIVELFQLLPRFYIPKGNNYKAMLINESISLFLLAFTENSRRYERNQLEIYDYYIDRLSSSASSIKNHSLTTLSSKPALNRQNNIQLTNVNTNTNTIRNSNKNSGKKKSKRVIAIPNLIGICNKQYEQHLLQANFFSCIYYQDSKYIMRKIGSYTLGLNKPNSLLDYLIEPILSHKSSMIFLRDIISWLNSQTISNKSYAFHSESHNCFCKKILLFTSIDTHSQSLENRAVKVYIYNERYKIINQIFKNFFLKGNVFSKLYVFFNGLLCLENGLQLGLLIHGFFISHYKLYYKEKKYYSYKCFVQKDEESYSLKSKPYFIIEVTSKDFVKASKDDVDTLIPAFLSFFIRITMKVEPNNKRNLIKRKNYLFSLDKVVTYLLRNKTNDYWNQLIEFYNMLIDKSKTIVTKN